MIKRLSLTSPKEAGCGLLLQSIGLLQGACCGANGVVTLNTHGNEHLLAFEPRLLFSFKSFDHSRFFDDDRAWGPFVIICCVFLTRFFQDLTCQQQRSRLWRGFSAGPGKDGKHLRCFCLGQENHSFSSSQCCMDAQATGRTVSRSADDGPMSTALQYLARIFVRQGSQETVLQKLTPVHS